MDILLGLGGVMALGLFIYLLVAMVAPEKFS